MHKPTIKMENIKHEPFHWEGGKVNRANMPDYIRFRFSEYKKSCDDIEVPLYYVESGSRVWGMASGDSDYDVRGFHIRTARQLYDFRYKSRTISFKDGDIDFVSHDIDKVFNMLSHSNASIFDMVRSSEEYVNWLSENANFIGLLWRMMDKYTLIMHHKGIMAQAARAIQVKEAAASGTFMPDTKGTLKQALYALRGMFCAELIRRGQLPKLDMLEMMKQFPSGDPMAEHLEIAHVLLERKRVGKEQDGLDRVAILHVADVCLKYAYDTKDMKHTTNNKRQLEEYLAATLRDIKFNNYDY